MSMIFLMNKNGMVISPIMIYVGEIPMMSVEWGWSQVQGTITGNGAMLMVCISSKLLVAL